MRDMGTCNSIGRKDEAIPFLLVGLLRMCANISMIELGYREIRIGLIE